MALSCLDSKIKQGEMLPALEGLRIRTLREGQDKDDSSSVTRGSGGSTGVEGRTWAFRPEHVSQGTRSMSGEVSTARWAGEQEGEHPRTPSSECRGSATEVGRREGIELGPPGPLLGKSPWDGDDFALAK